MFIAGGSVIANFFIDNLGISFLTTGLFTFVGVVVILIAILDLFVGRGLWKLQNWARIVAIVFAVLGILQALRGLFSIRFFGSLLNIILNGIIGYYLWFNVTVKKAFR